MRRIAPIPPIPERSILIIGAASWAVLICACRNMRSYAVERLISKKEAAKVVSFHADHLMRLVKAGRFPQPVRIGLGKNPSPRFVESEVQAWLEERRNERTAA
jgi:predicted DNA-binding transcriptional regulator AlpA